MQYIQPGQTQYKANLHSHSTCSDGHLTPEQLARLYQEHGYSILAITDHEAPYDNTALSTPGLLMLTGYEAYIRPQADGRIDPFGPEIHLNLLAREAHNRTFIAFDPPFCKYMPHALAQSLPQAGQSGPRSYSAAYINRFIRDAKEAGYLVTYNHPCWSMETDDRILQYEGCFSLELFNTGSQNISGYECNGALYDRLLRAGKAIYCHGSDDNHNVHPVGDPLCDSFGAWTMVLADTLEYGAVIRALEQGNFYASTGPTITALSFAGNKAHLECSAADRILMVESPKRCVTVYDPKRGAVCAADFEIPESAPYVRFSVLAKDGTQAHTRAFFRKELGV